MEKLNEAQRVIATILVASSLLIAGPFGVVASGFAKRRPPIHRTHRSPRGRYYTKAYGKQVHSPMYSRSVLPVRVLNAMTAAIALVRADEERARIMAACASGLVKDFVAT